MNLTKIRELVGVILCFWMFSGVLCASLPLSCTGSWVPYDGDGSKCIQIIKIEESTFNEASMICKTFDPMINSDSITETPILLSVLTIGSEEEGRRFVQEVLKSDSGAIWIKHTRHSEPESSTEVTQDYNDLQDEEQGEGGDQECLQLSRNSTNYMGTKTDCNETATTIVCQMSKAPFMAEVGPLKDFQSAVLKELQALKSDLQITKFDLQCTKSELANAKEEIATLKTLTATQTSILDSLSGRIPIETLRDQDLQTLKDRTQVLEAEQKKRRLKSGIEGLRMNQKLEEIKGPLQANSEQLSELKFQLDLLKATVLRLEMFKPEELENLTASSRSQFQILKSDQSNLESENLALKALIFSQSEMTSQNFKQLESMILASSGVQTDVAKLQSSVSSLKHQDSLLESQFDDLKGKDEETELAIDSLQTKDVRLDVKLGELVEQDRRFTRDFSDWKEKVKKAYKTTTSSITLYSENDYTGSSIHATVKGCLNILPSWVSITGNVGSVNLHGSCAYLYKKANCEGENDFLYKGVSSLLLSNYGKPVESIRSCNPDHQVPL